MAHAVVFREVEGRNGYYAVLACLGVLLALAALAFFRMEHEGHWITGMDNQIVWGMPHVFAVFLIVAASGALNVASVASVFSQAAYKPIAPLSGLLSIALLAGGLAVLVLDLGRPDRLIVAATTYNFKSIFAWNVILYTGFFAIVGAYLWLMMERRMQRHSSKAGMLAFIWRLTLTTGTGSIFGFLVAREAYDSALLAPMFIIFSFAYGTALFLVALLGLANASQRPVGEALLARLSRLLAVFVAASFYFTTVYHLTNLYITQRHGIERFILLDGGVHTLLFWLGQVGVGYVLPLVLLLSGRRGAARVVAASVLVVLGGLAQMWVTIIGAQAYPLELFPGFSVASSFFDGQIHPYAPSAWEIMLGVGGLALAAVIVVVAAHVLRFLPERLDGAEAAHG